MYGFDVGGNPDAKPCSLQKVTADSPAARAGLKQGDRLLYINGHQIETTDDAHRVLAEALMAGRC